MENKTKLTAIIAQAMVLGVMGNPDLHNEFVPRGYVSKSSNNNTNSKPDIEFKNQEGIVNMIKDYQLILKGKSKKNKLKQTRIVHKILGYVKSGLLTEEDLKL